MSEMIERVAEEIRKVHSTGTHKSWNDVARAAIEVMKEPTDEMLRFGAEAQHKYVGEWGAPDSCWKAMIQTALDGADENG